MAVDDEVVQTIDCNTAEEFLGRLSPQDPLWQPDPSGWIFRGHARAEWSLLSTAHRKDVRAYEEWGITEEPNIDSADWFRRQAAETGLWRRFYSALDEAGLTIPTKPIQTDDGVEVVHLLSEITTDGLPLLALAQHFGLPTSLLDWTRIAAKGAYFAAADLGVRDSVGHLAVWALKMKVLNAGIFSDRLVMRDVVAPLASNPNLLAQSGLFTQARGGAILAVDDYARKQFSEHSKELKPAIPLPWMHKITLPRSSAARLLQLLSYSGIHGSSMFPGYAGVVRRLREEAVWKKKPGS